MSEPQAEHKPVQILDGVSLCAQASGLPEERVAELAQFAQERDEPLVCALVERGGVDEAALLSGLAERLGLSYAKQEVHGLSGNVLKAISPAVATEYHVMPLGEVDGALNVACSDPFDWRRWDDLCYLLARPLRKVLSPRPVIERMLKANYGLGADTVERLLAGRGDQDIRLHAAGSTDLSEEEAANEPTVVNLVNRILTEAIRSNATDVHLEPYESRYRVRYRIDGMLEDVSIPVSVRLLRLAMVSRIKIMSNLDITEKRLPQDGRCQVSLAGQDYDLRVSILPGVHGEAVVIRLQSRQMARYDLDTLGFLPGESERIAHLISRPHGLLLVTGPTGSGKTTTLYACLSRIVRPQTKIITVEDPVEYWMNDILQMQVHEEIGFSFGRALRHMLRHDPDVMLVGEIRDRETAEIAIRCSLTGHLVFSTLHTNDAAGAPTRLADIGVEPYLIASSLQGIVAQRLVRRICPQCVRPADPDRLGELERRLMREAGWPDESSLREGAGCEKCRFTGYRGRTAVGEVLVLSAEIRELIDRRASAERIRQQARREDVRSLRDTALLAAKTGVTTISEILRVTQEDF